MYTGRHAHLHPLQPAFIMASTGEAVTYRELEARCNRLAHLCRHRGMKRLAHYAISMAKLDIARGALKECPKVELCIIVGGGGEGARIVGLEEATKGLPKTPIAE